jgi:predicted AlkP superfamily pyrophosphatase or phosphodiesterase
MSNMLPTRNSGLLSLAEVLPSCFASMGLSGFSNTLDLRPVRSAIVVLIDGLGFHNLAQARGHARFLASESAKYSPMETVFPSTTAAALATLATGVQPGAHGMVGYQVRNPDTGAIINQLTGLHALEFPQEWLRAKPLFLAAKDHGVTTSVIGHSRFANSSLTNVIYHGAQYVPTSTLEERLVASGRLIRETNPQLNLVYVSELDEIAHKKGVDSPQWAQALEEVDAAVSELAARLPRDVGLFFTADHGVVDIPATKHYLYGAESSFIDQIEAIGGEPRCPQLYFSPTTSAQQRQDFIAQWKKDFDGLAWVLDRDEAIAAGLFPHLNSENVDRAGDVFVLAQKNAVFYDDRDLSLKGRSMVGQHGGISDVEMQIPAIRLAGYANV